MAQSWNVLAMRLARVDMTGTVIRKATGKFVETELDGELVLMNIDNGRFHCAEGDRACNLAADRRGAGSRGDSNGAD